MRTTVIELFDGALPQNIDLLQYFAVFAV